MCCQKWVRTFSRCKNQIPLPDASVGGEGVVTPIDVRKINGNVCADCSLKPHQPIRQSIMITRQITTKATDAH